MSFALFLLETVEQARDERRSLCYALVLHRVDDAPDMLQANEDRDPHQHRQQFPLPQLLLSKGTLQAVRGVGAAVINGASAEATPRCSRA